MEFSDTNTIYINEESMIWPSVWIQRALKGNEEVR